MSHSIGKTIRKLRRERGLTQEELSEKIGVTAQAVSKWENESGMPDISQIVPLAHIFGVSADVLLGTGDVKNREDVTEILNRAQKMITFPLTSECIWNKYNVLLEGLKIYPNNCTLLIQCMEMEISLAYPNKDPVYDKENAEKLYKSCIAHANTIFSYDNDVNHILRAHQIMVMLHSAFGNFDDALKHVKKFPTRTDFDVHKMYSYFAHWQNDYKSEIRSLQFETMHFLHDLMRALVGMGKAYDLLGEENNAASTYESAIRILDAIFQGEIKMPFHHAEDGDIYVLLAEKYIKIGENERALDLLEAAIKYDTNEKKALIEGKFNIKTPILSMVGGQLGDRFQDLDSILAKECFDSVRDSERFTALCEKVKAFKTSG